MLLSTLLPIKARRNWTKVPYQLRGISGHVSTPERGQPLVLVVAIRRRLVNENPGTAIVADENSVPEGWVVTLGLHCDFANGARSYLRKLSAHNRRQIPPIIVPRPLRKIPYIWPRRRKCPLWVSGGHQQIIALRAVRQRELKTEHGAAYDIRRAYTSKSQFL